MYIALCGWDSRHCPHYRGVLNVFYIERDSTVVWREKILMGDTGLTLTSVLCNSTFHSPKKTLETYNVSSEHMLLLSLVLPRPPAPLDMQ